MTYGYLQNKIYREVANRIVEEFNGDDNFIGIIVDLCHDAFEEDNFLSDFLGDRVFRNDKDGFKHMLTNNFDDGGIKFFDSVYNGRYSKEHYYVGIVGNDDNICSFEKENVVEFIVRNYMEDVLFICGDDLGWDRVFEALYR